MNYLTLFFSQAGLLLVGMLAGVLFCALAGYIAFLSIQSDTDRKVNGAVKRINQVQATLSLLAADLNSFKSSATAAVAPVPQLTLTPANPKRDVALRLQHEGRSHQEISRELQIPSREVSLMLKLHQGAQIKISSTNSENLRKCS